MQPSRTPVIHMAGITKAFPNGVVANDDASLTVQGGTIHAVVGENGAGKTTLMNILYGRYRPDAGRIRLSGTDVSFGSPADAIRAGIGMVTQHSTFIPALTMLENVLLGHETDRLGVLCHTRALRQLEELQASVGVSVPWRARAAGQSVAVLQRGEIIKALFRRARILILDEPTASLAPQESLQLFKLLHHLAETGHTILLVTHKLGEVLQHAQRVTVLRAGHTVAEMPTDQTTAAELASLMVGPSRRVYLGADSEPSAPIELTAPSDAPEQVAILRHPPREPAVPLPVLEVQHLAVRSAGSGCGLRDVSLSVFSGEILGVAGVDGSGQTELCEAIAGLRDVQAGRVLLNGRDVTALGTDRRYKAGLAFCPEDRQRDGLVLPFSILENLLLGHHRQPEHGGGVCLNMARARDMARTAVAAHRIEPPDIDAPAAVLSGGNQQKLLVARCLLARPSALVALQLTRGLDVSATRRVYAVLREARAGGLGVLLVSLDLDELLDVCDRIAVLHAGRLVDTVARDRFDRDTIGHMMTTGEAP